MQKYYDIFPDLKEEVFWGRKYLIYFLSNKKKINRPGNENIEIPPLSKFYFSIHF